MPTPFLRFGSSGAEVAALQEALAARGFPPGLVDGRFGPGTEAAVLAFQHARGLLPDGIAGPRTREALGLAPPAPLPSVAGALSVEVASRMCPYAPLRNIQAHLPRVLQALDARDLGHRSMTLMAVATIRAETEAFLPVGEGLSRYNTSPLGHPFDLYDHRSDLGNQGPPDGERFRGRGFVQLTGRANYRTFGDRLGLDLLADPERANAPDVAAALLAEFLKSRELRIKNALLVGNLAQARRLVNGGSHGLDRFLQAFHAGDALLPP